MIDRVPKRWAVKRLLHSAIAVVIVLSVFLAYWAGRNRGTRTAQASTQQTQLDPQQQLKQWADKTAAPLLQELAESPDNLPILVRLGNIYCDAHQFEQCIGYYEHALKIAPRNGDVRTDLANAYYYSGDFDRAIGELSQALRYQPDHANALFNLGMIRWQAKQDPEGAVLAWQQLLKAHPDFALRKQVEDLIAKAKSASPSNIAGGNT